jgi:hypothetical protein
MQPITEPIAPLEPRTNTCSCGLRCDDCDESLSSAGLLRQRGMLCWYECSVVGMFVLRAWQFGP